MMRHLIWFVLALSLLFNLFFAAGFVQARARQAEAADGVSSLVAKELNLDETQSEVFSRLHSAMREDRNLYHDSMALARQELLSELGRGEPDLRRVRRIMGGMSELHQRQQQAGSRRFSEFIGVLSPQQCRRFSERMHGGRPGQWRDLLPGEISALKRAVKS